MLFVGRPYHLGQLERIARELCHEMRDSLEMLNAWSARQARRDKREAKSILELPEQTHLPLTPPPSRKAVLRSKVAVLRGLRAVAGDGSPETMGQTSLRGRNEPTNQDG